MKLHAVLGVWAALAAPAGAAGIPFCQNYTGPLVWHVTNWEDSVVYDYNQGFLKDGKTPITVGQAYPAGQVKVLEAGRATIGNETSWGIFQVTQILSAGIIGPNSISAGGITLYDKGASNIDIVGIFYGGVNQTVTFFSPTYTKIAAAGFKYEVFAQPENIYASIGTPALGAGARVDLNEFPTVGYDGTGANKLMAGAERILTANGQPGMAAQEFSMVLDVSEGTGSFDTYISVGALTEAFDSTGASVGSSGTGNAYFDTNIFPCGGFVPTVAGTAADFRLKGTCEPTNFNWLVRSLDPVTGGISMPGDANLDGVVDAADYIIVKKNLGTDTGLGVSAGDFNGSGKVDGADLQILMANFGAGGTAPATTPEPATLGLLVLGGLTMLGRRGRPRSAKPPRGAKHE